MKKRILIIILLVSASPLFAFKFSASSFFNAGEESSKAPTFFYQDSDIRFIDNGKKIFLGVAGFSNKQRRASIYFSDADKLSRIEKFTPIDGYFVSHPEMLINKSVALNIAGANYSFTLKKVIHYDETAGTASLVVQNYATRSEYDLGWFRYFLVNWDLKTDTVTSAHQLADGATILSADADANIKRKDLKIQSSIVMETLYDGTKRKGYICLAGEKGAYDGAGKRFKELESYFRIVETSANGVKEILSMKVPGKAPNRYFFDEATSTILAVVYTEFGKSGSAYLVDLSSGTSKLIETPLTVYGAAFDPDGIRLYMLSNKTGNIRVYNRKTGKVMQDFFAGTVAWLIGFVQKDELAFFNKDGIQIISTKGTLKTIVKMPASQYTFGQKPYNYPQGGLITQGNIYVGWNKTLYHVKYR